MFRAPAAGAGEQAASAERVAAGDTGGSGKVAGVGRRDRLDDGLDGTEPGAREVDPDEIDEPILKAALKLFGGTITKLERREAEDQ